MSDVKIFRETALPGTLQPYAIYLIAPPGFPDLVEMVVTDATGTTNRRVINKADIQAMIDASVAAAGAASAVFTADIAARDALAPASNVFAYVSDATGDATVVSGGATYLYNTGNGTWTKISEWESMDLVVQWASIQGRPTSLAADIDDAVAKRHTHANKTQLDKIDEDVNGNLIYGGTRPKIAWDSTGW